MGVKKPGRNAEFRDVNPVECTKGREQNLKAVWRTKKCREKKAANTFDVVSVEWSTDPVLPSRPSIPHARPGVYGAPPARVVTVRLGGFPYSPKSDQENHLAVDRLVCGSRLRQGCLHVVHRRDVLIPTRRRCGPVVPNRPRRRHKGPSLPHSQVSRPMTAVHPNRRRRQGTIVAERWSLGRKAERSARA